MRFYSRYLFPRLCDFFLNRPEIADLRRELLAQAQGDVLEIGFGTGLNLSCYPKGTLKITAVDPNPGMLARARGRIEASGIEVDRRAAHCEEIPFPSAAFDIVVSTFTLCSVGDIDRAIGEARRVLKPKGRFLFLEHGLSPEPTVRNWQRRLNWIERLVGDGCELDRDIRGCVESAGFASVQVDQWHQPKMPKTHGYFSRGVATKSCDSG